MPVIIFPSNVEIGNVNNDHSYRLDKKDAATQAKKWVNRIIFKNYEEETKELVQSSFPAPSATATDPMVLSTNSFVDSAKDAYNKHHHLRIRPDEVWVSILIQFNAYINKHAEELRGKFVAHDGKKELQVTFSDHLDRYTVDMKDFSQQISKLIQNNVVDPELRAWFSPNYSTTTEQDKTVANMVMMSSMQKYFSYACGFLCGLPSVTLLGEKADYEIMLEKLSKFSSYGKEPTQFADYLKPVIRRFIQSFEDPASEQVVDFWNRIFKKEYGGSGDPGTTTGWITAFCFWDEDGNVIPNKKLFGPPLQLDDIIYKGIDSDDIPRAFCKVPIKMEDGKEPEEVTVVVGSLIKICTKSDPDRGYDTVEAKSAWVMVESI